MTQKLLSFFILYIFSSALFLQAQESNIGQMTPEDYNNLELPPLQVLFENAQHTPTLQIQDIRKEGEISLLKKEKRSWLKFFSLGGGYSYGILGSTSGYSDVATPIYYQYNENTQHAYNISGSVSIPFEDLFDLRPKVKRQQLKIKEIELTKEQENNSLKQQIIDLYTLIISNLSILKVKSDAMVFANAQYQISENDFLNGKENAKILSEQKILQIEALSSYEQTRAVLNSSLLKLEILTNTSIISKKKH